MFVTLLITLLKIRKTNEDEKQVLKTIERTFKNFQQICSDETLMGNFSGY